VNYLERARRALAERRGLPAWADAGLRVIHTPSTAHPVAGTVDDVLAVSHGDVIEIRVPFLTDTLYFVRTDYDVVPLLKDGISRGRIWTVNELNDLFNIPDIGPSGRLTITLARALFDGEIVEVVRCAESDKSAISPSEEGSAHSGCAESDLSAERSDDGY